MQTSNEEWILALLMAEFAVALAWAFCQVLKAPSENHFGKTEQDRQIAMDSDASDSS